MKTATYQGRIALLSALAALAGLLAVGSAQAKDSFIERYQYQDEMNRCIDLLRPAVQADESGKVLYNVQEIDRRGQWYKFEIDITVTDASGAKTVDGYRVGCEANRWTEVAKLLERDNNESLPLQRELLASQQFEQINKQASKTTKL